MFDEVAELPRQFKATSEWLRLSLKYCQMKGIDLVAVNREARYGLRGVRIGDAANPGPPKAAARDVTLLDNPGHMPEVPRRRQKFIHLLNEWLIKHRRLRLIELLELEPRKIDRTVAAYGRFCFHANRSHLSFVETINAIIDGRPDLKRLFPGAWDLAWIWKGLQDSSNNLAMPAEVLQAAVGLTLVWGWADIALMLLVGYLGMLRPGELCTLTVQDFVFASVRDGKCALCSSPNQKCGGSAPGENMYA